MVSFISPLPATRTTGDTPTGGPASDVNAIRAAAEEIRTAILGLPTDTLLTSIFARLAQTQTVSGAWNFTTAPTVNGAAIGASSSTNVDAQPADNGLLTWTCDPAAYSTASQMSGSGTLNLSRVHLPVGATITTLWTFISTVGSGLTNSYAALYKAADRTLLGQTADQSTAWTSAGAKSMALVSPITVPAGDYYVAFWCNGTTPPAILRGAASGAINNLNISSAANYRWATIASAATTTAPSPLGTLSSGNNSFWAGLS